MFAESTGLSKRAVQEAAPRWSAGAWRVTWINPVSQAHNGRREGENIVQEEQLGDGTLIRWSFREITNDSFRWCGEASADGGGTWRLEAEFLVRRVGTR